MTPEIEKLRKKSLDTKVTLSHERAGLVTNFYRSGISMKESVPVQRGLCLKYILENKKICINEDELIVGERGHYPKAVPTYPEICLHSLDDLKMLTSREKIPYTVSSETMQFYKDHVIPFWKGKTIREKILSSMDKKWIDAFNAGMFTEFQEQRSPGHTACGSMIYKKGFNDLKKEIRNSIEKLDFFGDPAAFDKREELKAMDIAADALILFAERHGKELLKLAEKEKNRKRQKELNEMAEICFKVPGNAPETFHEALQYYWFLHVGVITELNPWDAFNPGRLDQNLYPFYIRDIEKGILTKQRAKELLSCFWIKFNNHPAPPKVGVTAKESNTYVDFCLINLGGLTKTNADGVNDLTYLILEVIEEMRLLQPSSMIQVSRKNPDRFIKNTIKIIATGFGQPSIFNSDTIIKELILQGKSIEDARQAGASGCVEAGVFGKECYILTGYFNLPKILEITLNNGTDPVTGKEIGLRLFDPEIFNHAQCFKTFDELFNAFKAQLEYFIDIKIKGNVIIENINAKYMPVPLLSLATEDCIEKGLDYNQGGARYNTSYIQGVGLGTITDCLASLKYNVFDKKRITMAEMLKALETDFNDNEDENENGDGTKDEDENQNTKLLHMVRNDTPKYGNDNDYADEIMQKIFKAYHGAVNGRPNAKGGMHRINLLPTTCHVYFGQVTGALPDGRKKGLPFSEGISPVQGADVNGPTAVIKSASKIDHVRTGGTLLNQKFMPDLLKDKKGIQSLVSLIRSYFAMDGHHIQFNVVARETLEKAKIHPENYRDLIVRVAGYSDYFVDLTPDLQDEIIKRTGHQCFF